MLLLDMLQENFKVIYTQLNHIFVITYIKKIAYKYSVAHKILKLF